MITQPKWEITLKLWLYKIVTCSVVTMSCDCGSTISWFPMWFEKLLWPVSQTMIAISTTSLPLWLPLHLKHTLFHSSFYSISLIYVFSVYRKILRPSIAHYFCNFGFTESLPCINLLRTGKKYLWVYKFAQYMVSLDLKKSLGRITSWGMITTNTFTSIYYSQSCLMLNLSSNHTGIECISF